ncbi:peptide/nickel transport system ATP-binding protein [Actinomadura meyerae]|jgi:peptide/nickel transport system ATP-binding protein|uniref:Peptide/nickel transport system ATP-binding protein n=1 Tax=Actinomadura meyerae TaxID=240840 RepID=A0A239MN98_9ACTN|nr:ATP-binding cassette domain-containing protein [Actinomadura meyerae]SNT43582.1 peptide/nickel transport system ATP-binding protein [Actinomadura meyerae]
MPAELCELTVHIDTGRWSETVLDAVDLVVPDGKITALLGESGCGKSIAAAALTGSLPDAARATGQVRIDGEPVSGRRQWLRLRGGTVGLLPQAGVTAFYSEDTVGAQLRALEDRHRRWSVDRACAAAGYPAELLDLYPNQHSGGQIQRAALAAALLPQPRILIADEPTASLDMETAYGVWVTLRRYADAGAAVLVITHDVPMLTATRVADRAVLMRSGKITATGDLSDLAALEDTYARGFFQPTTP